MISKLRINNYKSFKYNKKPDWLEFNKINIFIGENSHGKTNITNALRLISGFEPDYGGNIYRNRNILSLIDFNDKNKCIQIEAAINNTTKNISFEINPNDINKNISLPKNLRNKFFPIGAQKSIFEIIKDNRNRELLVRYGEKIRNELIDDMKIYFDIELKDKSSKYNNFFLFDVLDENDQVFLEAGSGRASILYYLLEIKLKNADNKTIFLFDEPEIHMHPSLQRQFLEYLSILAKDKNMQFFITSHSSIFIDNSILNKDTNIFQIKKENGCSKVTNITKDKKGLRDVVYNQLGYKPSDLLLYNAIIWVEGPSDIIYLKNWLKSKIEERKEDLCEGRDYSFLFYGGSCIAHLTIDQINPDQLIELCNINPNSVIIIDRDRDDLNQQLKPNAERIKDEFHKNGKFAWITGCREIENYIHPNILEKAVKNAHPKSAKFKIGSKQFDKMVTRVSGHKFEKVKTAQEVVNIYNTEASYKYDLWDLNDQLNRLIDEIKKAGSNT